MSTSVSPRSTAVHPTRQQLDELDALLQRMLDLPVNQPDEPAPPEPAAAPAPEFRPVSYSVPIADPPVRLEPRVVPDGVPQAQAPPVPPAALEPPPPETQVPGPDDWVRLASTWQPSAQTWQPLAQSWHQAARPSGRPAAPPVPEPTPPLPAPDTVYPPREAVLPQESPPPAEEPVWGNFAPSPAEVPADDAEPGPAAETAAVASPARAGYAWWQWPLVAVNALFDVLTLPLGPFGAGLRSRIGRNLLAVVGVLCFVAAVVLAVADGIGWIW